MSSSPRLIFAAQYWWDIRLEVGNWPATSRAMERRAVAKMVLLDTIVPVMLQRDGIAGGTPKSVIDSIRAGVAHMIVHRSTKSCRRRSSAPPLRSISIAPTTCGTATPQGMRRLVLVPGLKGWAAPRLSMKRLYQLGTRLHQRYRQVRCTIARHSLRRRSDRAYRAGLAAALPSVVPHAILDESLPWWCSRYRDCRS